MRAHKRNPYYGMGLDKRQARRQARRDGAKRCTCYSTYEDKGRRIHFAECRVIWDALGY